MAVPHNFDIKPVFSLYEQYAALGGRYPHAQDCIDLDIDNIRKALESENFWISNINPTLPMQQIDMIFDKYQVIQLREVGISKNLLLGCGNTPALPAFKTNHQHAEMETINPQLSMNPSIVAAWGEDEGLNCILPQGHYENLYGEAMALCMCSEYGQYSATRAVKDALKCLTDNFKTFELIRKQPFESLERSSLLMHYGCDHNVKI